MRNTIFIGIIVLLIGMFTTYLDYEKLDDFDGISLYGPGILVGLGLGLIFGSLVGYQSKKKKLKNQEKSLESKL